MTRRAKGFALLRRFATARTASKRIWQTVLAAVLLLGMYALLPAADMPIARVWLETFLSRFR